VTQSMTGFAERHIASPRLRGRFTLKSLNHRFFEWSYKGLPLGRFESRLRAACQQRIQRGKVEVWLELDFPDASFWDVAVNEPLLNKLVAALTRAAGRNRNVQFSVDNALRLPQVVELRRKDLTRRDEAFLGRTFGQALDDLVRDRTREGRDIAGQLRTHVRTIEGALARLQRLLRRQRGVFQSRLRGKLRDIPEAASVSEGRLVEEAALQAQRYDITEEIARLRSHLTNARALLDPARKEPVGKMLDFLAQELYREANTINSKSQDLAITRESLLVKAEIESIRQQVQNLE
jgi:uncharacterized protein (TIGR00255 family)